MIVGNVPVCKAEWESRQEKCRSILEVRTQLLDIKEMLRCINGKIRERKIKHTCFKAFFDEAEFFWWENRIYFLFFRYRVHQNKIQIVDFLRSGLMSGTQ